MVFEYYQDRKILFDQIFSNDQATNLAPGEFAIMTQPDISDLKTSTFTPGKLTLTNLRLIWRKSRFSNITIGLSTVESCRIVRLTELPSYFKGLDGDRWLGSPVVTLTCQSDQYGAMEFSFGRVVNERGDDAVGDGDSFFGEQVLKTFRLYQSTVMYRDVKSRNGSICFYSSKSSLATSVPEIQLNLLAREKIYQRLDNAWNIAMEEGHPGLAFITNMRFIWQSLTRSDFNISIPYLQVESVKLMTGSRYGKALLFVTTKRSGSLRLGFRIDPQERVVELVKEVIRYWTMFHGQKEPDLGIIKQTFSSGSGTVQSIEQDLTTSNEDDGEGDQVRQLEWYYNQSDINDEETRIIFDDSILGLAIEIKKEENASDIQNIWQSAITQF